MRHTMGLDNEYFRLMKEGKKRIEVRLNDEKRRKIKIGDTIKFKKLSGQDEVMEVEVTNLTTYSGFQEMYKQVPFVDMGCGGWTMDRMINGTFEIYSKEQETQWGALAIEVKLF